MANFGPLTKGQLHSPDVNLCVLHFSEGHQEPCNEVGSLGPAKHLVGLTKKISIAHAIIDLTENVQKALDIKKLHVEYLYYQICIR